MTVFLPDSFTVDFRYHTRLFEGVKNFMYLDAPGHVSTGCGHLIASVTECCALPWEGGNIAADFMKVKGAVPGKDAQYYAALTSSRLPAAAVDALLDKDTAEKTADLMAALPECVSWPPPARQALLDMSFNLGAHGLVSKYPRMLAAMLAGDWETAAAESHRNGIQPERNDYTKLLILTA